MKVCERLRDLVVSSMKLNVPESIRDIVCCEIFCDAILNGIQV